MLIRELEEAADPTAHLAVGPVGADRLRRRGRADVEGDDDVVAAGPVAVVGVQGEGLAVEVVAPDEDDVVLEHVPRRIRVDEDEPDRAQPAGVDLGHDAGAFADALVVETLPPDDDVVIERGGGLQPPGDHADAGEAVDQPGQQVLGDGDGDGGGDPAAQLRRPAVDDVPGQERHPAAQSHRGGVDRDGRQPHHRQRELRAGGPRAVGEQRRVRRREEAGAPPGSTRLHGVRRPQRGSGGVVDDEVAVVLQHHPGARVTVGAAGPPRMAVGGVRDQVPVALHDQIRHRPARRVRRPQRPVIAGAVQDGVSVALHDESDRAVVGDETVPGAQDLICGESIHALLRTRSDDARLRSHGGGTSGVG